MFALIRKDGLALCVGFRKGVVAFLTLTLIPSLQKGCGLYVF